MEEALKTAVTVTVLRTRLRTMLSFAAKEA